MKVTKYPWIIVLLTLLVTVYFGMQLPDIIFTNDVDKFLPKDAEARHLLDKLEEEFGVTDPIVIGFTVKHGEITSPENLKTINDITEKMALIDSVSDVKSLSNTDYISGADGAIETEPMVATIPTTKEDEDEIKNRLSSWELYKGMLYTEDFKSSVIIMTTEEISQDRAGIVYNEILEIINPYKDNFEFQVAGTPVLYALISGNMQKDVRLLIPLVLLVVIVILLLSFGRMSGVVLPIVAVIVSTVITLGLMALLGVELTLLATIIPVLLVAVGSAYGIHIICHYYVDVSDAGKDGESLSHDQHNEVLNKTLQGVGKGVLLATLTTIAGFASLAASKVVPVQEFGIFTAIGVAVAFLVAVVLIPALLQIKHNGVVKKTKESKGVKALLKLIVKFTAFRRTVIIIAVSSIAFTILMLSQLLIGDTMVHFFKKGTTLRNAIEWFDENSNGTVSLNIRFEADETGGLVEPLFLQTVDKMQFELKEKHPEIGAIISFADFVKKLNEVVMIDEDGDFYEIPSDYKKYGLESEEQLRPLISQYLMLFSGDLEDFVDDGFEPTVTKAVIQIKSDDMQRIMIIVDAVEAWLSENMPKQFTYELSGSSVSEIALTDLLIHSQAKSIIFSLLAVFIILSLYFRSAMAGLIGMLILSIPVLLNFGVMATLKIPLDASASMIASIAIGIGIDYVIHFLNHYSLEMKKGVTYEEASKLTIMASGKPILYNALSVAFGFMVLLLSQFVPLKTLGGMIAFTMLTSSLVSLTVLPVILITFKPKYLIRK